MFGHQTYQIFTFLFFVCDLFAWLSVCVASDGQMTSEYPVEKDLEGRHIGLIGVLSWRSPAVPAKIRVKYLSNANLPPWGCTSFLTAASSKVKVKLSP
jgi:hypothetical protein